MKKDDHVGAELADAHALRALDAGTASPEQQKRALKWILTRACQIGDPNGPWRETDRDTAFACGRLYVGKQIGRLLICDLSSLRRQSNVDSPSKTSPTR